MNAPIRHGRARREWSAWPIIIGCLIGIVVGVWVFGSIWGAIR